MEVKQNQTKRERVRRFVLDCFSVVTMILGNKSYTDGKPVYFPFERCHICKNHPFVG